MDLTEISLEALLVSGPDDIFPTDPDRINNLLPFYSEYVVSRLTDLGHRYTFHQSGDQAGDVLLLNNGDVVGGYVCESLDIVANHIGEGLSTPLILAAVPQRDLPRKRIVTAAGRLRSLPRGRQPTVGDEVLGTLRRQLRPNSTKAAFATSKFDRPFRRALLERCRKIVAIGGQPRHSRRVNQGKRIE